MDCEYYGHLTADEFWEDLYSAEAAALQGSKIVLMAQDLLVELQRWIVRLN